MDTKKEILELMKFDFTHEGDVKTFLRVSVEKKSSDFHFSYPHLVSRVLKAIGLTVEENSGRNNKDTSKTKTLLINDTNGEPRFLPWNYWSVIGIVSYLSGSTRPDISIAGSILGEAMKRW